MFVKLKKLIIHGFKSFRDRTIIYFNKGITGIVGPNGCGKSNIVDALFWVMGEQSAKHLRGQVMKDVIFSGSEKKRSSSWAEVTLVIDNEKGVYIHVGEKVFNPSEIQITRKLYRNGEAEYSLNQEPCRLKDIQRVFMDTGAGVKSYSIIAQGEIDRLVQAKPEERRSMIEEVAGVTKYKVRKKESLKKIEQAVYNLKRLTDLRGEIDKTLKTLKTASKRAEKGKTLKEKVKKYELLINSHKMYEYLKTMKDSSLKKKEMEVEKERYSIERVQVEVSLEKARIERDSHITHLDEVTLKRMEISQKFSTEEERLKGKYTQKREREKSVLERNGEIEELQVDLYEREKKLKELREIEKTFKNTNDEPLEIQEPKEDEVKKIESLLKHHKLEYSNAQKNLFQYHAQIKELSDSMEDRVKERDSLQATIDPYVSRELKDREYIQKSSEDLRKMQKNLEEIKVLIVKDLQREEVAEKLYFRCNENFIKYTSQMGSLKDSKRSCSKLYKFLNSLEGKSIKKLEDLLTYEEKFAKSIELLLKPFEELLICREKNSMDNLLTWSTGAQGMGVDFLLDGGTLEKRTVTDIELLLGTSVYPLSQIVQYPEKYKDILENFFEGFYVIEKMNIVEVSLLPFDDSVRGVVTIDGKVQRTKNIVSTFQYEKKKRKDDLKSLIVQARTLVLKEKSQLLKIREEKKQHEKEEKLLVTSLIDIEGELVRKEMLLKGRNENRKVSEERISRLGVRQKDLSKRRELLMAKEKIEKDELRFLKYKLNETEKILAKIKDRYSLEKDHFIKEKVKALTDSEREKQISATIKDLVAQIKKQSARVDSFNARIVQDREKIDEITCSIVGIKKNNDLLVVEIKGKDRVLSELKETLEASSENINKKIYKIKNLEIFFAKNEKMANAMVVKTSQILFKEEQIVRNIFEKYHIDLRQCLGEFLDFTKEDFRKLNDLKELFLMEDRDGSRNILKQEYLFHHKDSPKIDDYERQYKRYKAELHSLGDIHWQAVEDFEKQKTRSDFLQKQEADLNGSLTDLKNAIDLIENKVKERFKLAFLEVSSQFSKVFPIIFGGGSGRLKIVGNIDDVDAGVDIIVQPPGKKMQNINLMSGGEKAMTTVSLIFSIFLVKPSPFCLLDEVDAPLDDANIGRFKELLKGISGTSQFILITHNKKTMELNDSLYGITMQEPGVSYALSAQLH